MADFNEDGVSEAEAGQFKKDYDERVAKAREGMGYKKAPEAEVPVDTEIDAPEVSENEPEEEVEPETEEEEEESEPEELDSQTRDKSVFRQLNEIRSQKRAAETEKAKLLEDYNKILEENKALKANQPPPQPFLDYAKKNGIEDPKSIKDLYDTFRSQMDEDFGAKITALDEKIQSYEAKEVERAEAGAYQDSMGKLTDEWSTVVPVIESEYKPTASQLDEAFSLMADLAHNEKYHDKELDYILFKEASQFEQIFGARRRRTMFSSHGRASGESKTPLKRDGSHESIMALKKEMDAKKNGNDGFSVVADGEI